MTDIFHQISTASVVYCKVFQVMINGKKLQQIAASARLASGKRYIPERHHFA